MRVTIPAIVSILLSAIPAYSWEKTLDESGIRKHIINTTNVFHDMVWYWSGDGKVFFTTGYAYYEGEWSIKDGKLCTLFRSHNDTVCNKFTITHNDERYYVYPDGDKAYMYEPHEGSYIMFVAKGLEQIDIITSGTKYGPKERAEAAKNRPEFVRELNELRNEAAKVADAPDKVLKRGYVAYINTQKCFDYRKGYALGYVSEPAYEEARASIKAIESRAIALSSNIDTKYLWVEADKEKYKSISPALGAIGLSMELYARSSPIDDEYKMFCQSNMDSLRNIKNNFIPGGARAQKDF